MFPSSLREGNEIVHQSHKVGACPPPRLKHFYRESLFLFIAFAGSILHLQERSFELFFDSFRYYNCTGPSPRSGPKMWSSPQYPQGGWARYISSGRMSSRTILCSFTTMVVVTKISSGRMSSLHILSEDELEDHSWFSLLLGYLVTISSWRMGSRTTHGSLFTTMIPSHCILRENELSSCPHTYRCGGTWGV